MGRLKDINKKCQLLTSIQFNERCVEDYSEIVRQKLVEYLDRGVKVRMKVRDSCVMIVDRTVRQRKIHYLPFNRMVETKIDEISSKICYLVSSSGGDKHNVTALFCKSANDTQKIVSQCQFRIRSLATYKNHEWLNLGSFSGQPDSSPVGSVTGFQRAASLNTTSSNRSVSRTSLQCGHSCPMKVSVVHSDIKPEHRNIKMVTNISCNSSDLESERISGDGEDTNGNLTRTSNNLVYQSSNNRAQEQRVIDVYDNFKVLNKPLKSEANQLQFILPSGQSKGLLMSVSPIEYGKSDSLIPYSAADSKGLKKSDSSSDLSELDAVISGLQRLTGQSKLTYATQNMGLSCLPERNEQNTVNLKHVPRMSEITSEERRTISTQSQFTGGVNVEDGVVFAMQSKRVYSLDSNNAVDCADIVIAQDQIYGLITNPNIPVCHLDAGSSSKFCAQESELSSLGYLKESDGSNPVVPPASNPVVPPASNPVVSSKLLSFKQALIIYDQLTRENQTKPIKNTASMISPSSLTTTTTTNNNCRKTRVGTARCASEHSPPINDKECEFISTSERKKFKRFFDSIEMYGPEGCKEPWVQPDVVIDSLGYHDSQ